jgi:hypothetical protein
LFCTRKLGEHVGYRLFSREEADTLARIEVGVVVVLHLTGGG